MANARQFFDDFVCPTIAEFAEDTTDLRRAILCVQIVDASVSQVFYSCEEAGFDAYQDLFVLADDARPRKADDSSFRELLADQHEVYRVHRDLAKAIKHGSLERGQPLVISTDSVTVRALGYGEGGYGVGPYGGGPRAQVELVSGEHIDIHWVVRQMAECVEHLIELMEDKSII